MDAVVHPYNSPGNGCYESQMTMYLNQQSQHIAAKLQWIDENPLKEFRRQQKMSMIGHPVVCPRQTNQCPSCSGSCHVQFYLQDVYQLWMQKRQYFLQMRDQFYASAKASVEQQQEKLVDEFRSIMCRGMIFKYDLPRHWQDATEKASLGERLGMAPLAFYHNKGQNVNLTISNLLQLEGHFESTLDIHLISGPGVDVYVDETVARDLRVGHQVEKHRQSVKFEQAATVECANQHYESHRRPNPSNLNPATLVVTNGETTAKGIKISHLKNCGSKGRGSAAKELIRKKETKYHFLVSWKIPLPGLQNAPPVNIISLSLPFMVCVEDRQRTEQFGELFLQCLCSPDDTANLERRKDQVTGQPLTTVPRYVLLSGLQRMFFKITGTRPLRDGELDHINGVLFGDQMPITGVDLVNANVINELLPDRGEYGRQRRRWDKQGTSTDGAPPDQSKIRYEHSFIEWYLTLSEFVSFHGKKGDKRQTVELYKEGIIHGMYGKRMAEKLLDECDKAIMLIRFSDHFKGTLTISYKKSGDSKVQHIRPVDKKLGLSIGLVVKMLLELDDVDDVYIGKDENGRIKTEKKAKIIAKAVPPTRNLQSDETYKTVVVMCHVRESDKAFVQEVLRCHRDPVFQSFFTRYKEATAMQQQNVTNNLGGLSMSGDGTNQPNWQRSPPPAYSAVCSPTSAVDTTLLPSCSYHQNVVVGEVQHSPEQPIWGTPRSHGSPQDPTSPSDSPQGNIFQSSSLLQANDMPHPTSCMFVTQQWNGGDSPEGTHGYCQCSWGSG